MLGAGHEAVPPDPWRDQWPDRWRDQWLIGGRQRLTGSGQHAERRGEQEAAQAGHPAMGDRQHRPMTPTTSIAAPARAAPLRYIGRSTTMMRRPAHGPHRRPT
jgi:hypothetical protein